MIPEKVNASFFTCYLWHRILLRLLRMGLYDPTFEDLTTPMAADVPCRLSGHAL